MDRVNYIGFIDSDHLYTRRLLQMFAPGVKELFSIKDIDELAFFETNAPISQPLVVVFDPLPSDANELTYAIKIRKAFPDAILIILSEQVSEQSVLRAFETGIDGYLTKDLSLKTIVELISTVFEGGTALAPNAATGLVSFFRRSTFQLYFLKKLLTAREIDVLLKLKEGLSYNEIAGKLYISPKTVNQHLKSIYKKLKVENRAQLMARFYNVDEFKDGVNLETKGSQKNCLSSAEVNQITD